MIVPMKKVTVVALSHTREDTLEILQKTGVLHVETVPRPAGSSASDVTEQRRAAQRAVQFIDDAVENTIGTPSDVDTEKAPAEIVQKISALVEKRTRIDEQRIALVRQKDDLEVWGEFDPARIDALKEKGIHVYLYICRPEEMPNVPDTATIHEIRRKKSYVAFALISKEEFTCALMPVKLPEKSLHQIEKEIQETISERNKITREIAGYAAAETALEAYVEELEDTWQRAIARDNMNTQEKLIYLQGYIPAEETDRLSSAARHHGWGLFIDDPTSEDDPPTLIRTPKWAEPILSVFNFIDTFPGYRERDISILFYFFFSLFYAMLIGDAGYGAVMLLITITVHVWKGKKIPKEPLYLLYILNGATVVWGVLTGSYFGIELPQYSVLRDVMILDTSNFGQTVYFCFLIAVVQLFIAHVWNAIKVMNSIQVLAEIGYAGVVVTMYFLANTLILNKTFPQVMIVVAIISLALAFAGSVIGKKGEDLMATIFQFPFGIINSFGDIASYIRLFAVGYATMATAQAFNLIASEIGFSHIFAGLAAALILLAGHALNMILGLMSVMVHGLRLNMLEFSTHLGQEWSGKKYNPLQHKTVRDKTPA